VLEHIGGGEEGGFHTLGVGGVASYDVEGGAMVGAGADDGQADGNVDGGIEGEHFEGDESLVVVHGDDDVPFAVEGLVKEGVGREGALDVDAGFLGHEDGGCDDALLFVAELAMLGGVGVEGGDGDAWFFDVEVLAQGVVGEVDGSEDAADGEAVSEFEECFVNGGENDAEGAADEHHGDFFCTGAIFEQFGVAWVAVAGELPGFFADGCGDEGVYLAFFGVFDGVVEEFHGGFAALLARFFEDVSSEPWYFVVVCNDNGLGVGAVDAFVLVAPPEDVEFGEVGGVCEEFVKAIDDVSGAFADVGIGEGLYDDLRADAGRVAHGDADDGLVKFRQTHVCSGP